MISSVGVTVLQMLSSSDQPVSGRKIAFACNISLNTLIKEITLLNDDIHTCGLRVISSASRGYSLTYDDPEKAEVFLREYMDFCYRFAYLDLFRMRKYYLIMRLLLNSPGSVSLHTAADALFCSVSSVSRLLPECRRLFARYGITLRMMRGRGIIAEGTEWDKRMCLMFLGKVAFAEREEERILKDIRRNSSEQADTREKRMQDGIYAIMKKYPVISVPQRARNPLFFYVGLCVDRSIPYPVQFSEEQRRTADTDIYYPAAEEVLTLAAQIYDVYPFRKEEIIGLSACMRMYCTLTSSAVIPKEELMIIKRDITGILAAIEKQYPQISYDRIQLEEDLLRCLYSLEASLRFGIPYDREYHYTEEKTALLTGELLVTAARWYKKEKGITLSREQIMTMYYPFHQAVSLVDPYPYPQHVLVSSVFGEFAASSISAYMKAHYGKQIASVRTISRITAEELQDPSIDLIVTDGRLHVSVPDMHAQVIVIRSLNEPADHIQLEQYFSRLMLRKSLSLFPEDHLHFIDDDKYSSILQNIAHAVKGTAREGKILQQLKKKEEMLTSERINGIVLLSPAVSVSAVPVFHVFINNKPLYRYDTPSTVYIYYDLASGNLRDIQRVMSLARAFMDLPALSMEELPECTYAGLCDQLLRTR